MTCSHCHVSHKPGVRCFVPGSVIRKLATSSTYGKRERKSIVYDVPSAYPHDSKRGLRETLAMLESDTIERLERPARPTAKYIKDPHDE